MLVSCHGIFWIASFTMEFGHPGNIRGLSVIRDTNLSLTAYGLKSVTVAENSPGGIVRSGARRLKSSYTGTVKTWLREAARTALRCEIDEATGSNQRKLWLLSLQHLLMNNLS